MQAPRLQRLLPIGLALALAATLALPAASADTEINDESFESFDVLDAPSSDFYTFTTSGTGNAYVTTAQAHGGTKSYLSQGNTVISSFETSSNLCSDFDFWWRISGYPSGTTTLMGVSTSSSAPFPSSGATEWVGIQIGTSGGTNLAAKVAGSSSVTTSGLSLTAAVNTWYHFQIDCSGTQAILRELTTIVQTNLAFTGTASKATFSLQAGSAGTFQQYADDLHFENTVTPAGYWCSSPGATNFGYDFKEDVTEDNAQIGITIDPFYHFEGSSGDYGYLGKSWGGTQSSPTTGSTHVRAYFRIEAEATGGDSNFRAAFTGIRATGTPGVPVMNKGTGGTAGDSSGDFSEHLEARFLEVGSKWNMAFFYVSASGSVTTRTQYGSAADVDSPNSPHSYYFDVDTVGNVMTIGRVDDDDPEGAGVVILTNTVPSPFSGDSLYGLFLLGFDSTISGEVLALDENAETDLSTCIGDLNGLTAFNGDPGRDPDTIDIIDPNPGSDDTDDDTGNAFRPAGATIPEGFTATTLDLFLGVLLLGTVSLGFYSLGGKSNLMGAIGALVGLFMGYAFGLIDVWVIVVLTVVCLTIGALMLKRGAA